MASSHTPDEEIGIVTLCGGQGCCPTIDFTGEKVVIRDDLGGRAELTPAEWAELKRRFAR